MHDLESDGDDLWITGVESGLDGDNQLRDDWKDLGATLVEHIEHSLNSEESVWVDLFPNALEEDWKIMMVIELLNVDFPVDLILGSVLDGHWEISSVVESSELRKRDFSAVYSTSSWLLGNWLGLWLVERHSLSSVSITLLQDGSATSSN